MDSEINRQKEGKSSHLDDKTQQLSKKVWDIDNRQPEIVDIPESGIDQRMINKVNNGTTIVGKDHNGDIQNYLIKDNRIYKSSNYTEV